MGRDAAGCKAPATRRCRSIVEEPQRSRRPWICPNPLGRQDIGADLRVVRRRRCFGIASSSLLDLVPKSSASRPRQVLLGALKRNILRFEANRTRSDEDGFSPAQRASDDGNENGVPIPASNSCIGRSSLSRRQRRSSVGNRTRKTRPDGMCPVPAVELDSHQPISIPLSSFGSGPGEFLHGANTRRMVHLNDDIST